MKHKRNPQRYRKNPIFHNKQNHVKSDYSHCWIHEEKWDNIFKVPKEENLKSQIVNLAILSSSEGSDSLGIRSPLLTRSFSPILENTLQ